MSETTPCPHCGTHYQSLTIHWAKSSTCDYPSFTDTHIQILDGLFACGGTFIDIDSSKNSSFRISTTNNDLLEWIDEQFGVFGRGVRQIMSAEDAAESIEARFGPRKDGEDINASEVYGWETISHPDIFRFYATWTDDTDESRRVPEDYAPSRLTLAVINAFQGHLTLHGSDETEFQSTFHTSATPIPTEDWVTLFDGFEPTLHSQHDAQLVVLRDTQGYLDWLSESEAVPDGGLPGGSDAWPSADQPLKGVRADAEMCPDCKARYNHLGHHWAQGDCEPPTLDDEWVEFCKGLLLAGNSIESSSTHTFLIFYTRSLAFAEWLSESLGVLANPPQDVSATVENPWGDGTIDFASYRVQTRRVPQFDIFSEWEQDGTRTIPYEDIEPSSTLVRGFYAARGSLQAKNGPARMPTIPIGELAAPDAFYHRILAPYQPCIVHNDPSHYITLRNRAELFRAIGDPIPGREDTWLDPDDITEYEAEQCPDCGNWYNELSVHTARSSCSV